MPTYEYKCLDCNHKVEYFQWMTEEPRTKCPRCNGRLVRLVSSGAGLIFKGTGFYITDYKKKEDSFKRKNGAHRPHNMDSEKKDKSSSKDEKSVTVTEKQKAVQS
ncbi:MAG: zinc ribbon domain-containing protein [Calditrichaeota bacterium]|nr:zinc ribbon domain-containing protein [Calditrichota bacterium]